VAAPTSDDALGCRRRQPGAHELDHLLDREAGREQFECAAAAGIGFALAG
jgi:hypothetical protein